MDQQIKAIVELTARRLDGRLRAESLRHLVKPTNEARVADASEAYYIDGVTRQDDCVLTVSAPDFPEAVEQSASSAVQASALLGGTLGGAVCVPLLIDRCEGRSFAVYPRLRAFSENRYLRRVQTRRAGPAILDWLAESLAHTAKDRLGRLETESRFLHPLRCLIGDDDIPARVRSAAEAAVRVVEAGRIRTLTCLQHGDFWFGNILFEPHAIAWAPPLPDRFRVIDWGSSRPDGYAGIDAVRFLLSSFGPGRYASAALDRYCSRAGLSVRDAAVGCLCALGRLATELNEFPKQNFVAMATSVHAFLDQCGALADLATEERSQTGTARRAAADRPRGGT